LLLYQSWVPQVSNLRPGKPQIYAVTVLERHAQTNQIRGRDNDSDSNQEYANRPP
jgi:hypothetical protein